MARSLDDLVFDNSYLTLPAHFYQRTKPSPLPQAHVLSINTQVANLLELDPCLLNQDTLAPLLSGQQLPDGAHPLAMKYTGHQFGGYNPELGDGRGLLLGEILTSNNERWDLHLKGAGKTRFSRFGDGRAVVRSSLREYLVGEALTALNIPSTRALALCASPEPVQREEWEPAATILRISQCHIRFGHFEYCFYNRRHDDLKILADYCIKRFYPDCQHEDMPYLSLLISICKKSAAMVAGWQAYGFLHGVLNTDNMSLIGETFDHGPFAFIDYWDENAVYNHTDHQGRYAFGKQPAVVQWNLACLAQALSPLIESEFNDNKAATQAIKQQLNNFIDDYQQSFYQRMCQRLGLCTENQPEEKLALIKDLCQWLQTHKQDMHALLRALGHAQNALPNIGNSPALVNWLSGITAKASDSFRTWLERYQLFLLQEKTDDNNTDHQRQQKMLMVNPKYVFRTHIAQHIIDQTHQGDFQALKDWLFILQNPYDEHPEFERWSQAVKQPGHTQLSCSS